MVRESHGGAGQGVTLIRVVVRATERGKVLRARVGNVRTARHLRRECREARVPTRVARARARYGRRVGWAGPPAVVSATMGWRAVAPWWAIALIGCGLGACYLQFWCNSQDALFGQALELFLGHKSLTSVYTIVRRSSRRLSSVSKFWPSRRAGRE